MVGAVVSVRDWGVFRLHVGDCLESLRQMAGESVHCCVTSPPYFGLRDYGHAGQIGLEPTPAEFVANLVDVFREVRRLLRDNGTLWLNLGDSYGRGGRTENPSDATRGTGFHATVTKAQGYGEPVLSQRLQGKQLLGIPWRVAFALQADGWFLRQDIIWSKPNPMPESTTDRCTKAHEYLFLLSKSRTYYYDAEAIKEPAVGTNLHDVTGQGYAAPGQTPHRGGRLAGNVNPAKGQAAYEAGDEKQRTKAGLLASAEKARAEGGYFTRNKRSVWTVATRGFKGAHFATFPPALIEPCVLAGAPVGGVVLDPFGGAGTTALVAAQHGRIGVLCELNPDYADMAERRIAAAVFGSVAHG